MVSLNRSGVVYLTGICTLTKVMASRYKKTQFKTALKAFCEYYGFELNPIELCGINQANIDSRRIVKTIDGRSTEVFFISTTKIKEQTKPDGDIAVSEDMPF